MFRLRNNFVKFTMDGTTPPFISFAKKCLIERCSHYSVIPGVMQTNIYISPTLTALCAHLHTTLPDLLSYKEK